MVEIRRQTALVLADDANRTSDAQGRPLEELTAIKESCVVWEEVGVLFSYFLSPSWGRTHTRIKLFWDTRPGGAKHCHMSAAGAAADWWRR